MSILKFVRGDKEILHADDPSQAYNWAVKIRENISGTPDENLVSVAAEGFRVIIARKSTVSNKRQPVLAK